MSILILFVHTAHRPASFNPAPRCRFITANPYKMHISHYVLACLGYLFLLLFLRVGTWGDADRVGSAARSALYALPSGNRAIQYSLRFRVEYAEVIRAHVARFLLE